MTKSFKDKIIQFCPMSAIQFQFIILPTKNSRNSLQANYRRPSDNYLQFTKICILVAYLPHSMTNNQQRPTPFEGTKQTNQSIVLIFYFQWNKGTSNCVIPENLFFSLLRFSLVSQRRKGQSSCFLKRYILQNIRINYTHHNFSTPGKVRLDISSSVAGPRT